MKIEVDITKKYAFLIASVLVLCASLFLVVAYNPLNSPPANPSVFGHSSNEVTVNISGTQMGLQQAIDSGLIGYLGQKTLEVDGVRSYVVPNDGKGDEYVVIASPSKVGVVLPLDNSIITNLCSDHDACTITIGMFNYNGDFKTAGRGPWKLFFTPQNPNSVWRISDNDDSGTDVNANAQESCAWDCCFTDGETSTNSNNGRTDNAAGFGFINIKGGSYSDTNTQCQLIIED